MVGLGLGTLGALAAAQPANAAYSCVGCSAKEKARLESERREELKERVAALKAKAKGASKAPAAESTSSE